MILVVINLLYIMFFACFTRNINVYAFSLFFRSFFGAAILYFFLRHELRGIRFNFDMGVINDYLKYVIPLLPATVLGFIYDKIDPIIMKQFLSFSEIGLFVASQKFNILLLTASASSMTILFSSFSEHAANKDYSKIEEVSNRATKYISIPVTFVSLFLVYNTAPFISFFMSDAYLPAVPIIQVFMFQVVLMSVSRTFDSIVLATERLYFVSVMGILLYSIGIFLDYVLIPKELFGVPMFGLGASGPAFKSLIIYALSIISGGLYLFYKLKISIYWRFIAHICSGVVAGFISSKMALVVGLTGLYSLIFSFCFFSIIYFLFLIVCGELRKDDLTYMKKIFQIAR